MALFTETRTLAQIHAQLMDDIRVCDNMISPDPADQYDEIDLIGEMQDMQEQLLMIEEIMSLKQRVDCDCFYA